MSTRCEHCGFSIEDGNAFCTRCGVRRSQAVAGTEAQRLCARCGSPLPSGTKFCTKCGAESGSSRSDAGVTPAEMPPSDPHTAQSQWQTVMTSPPAGSTTQTAKPAAPSGGIPRILIVALVAILLLTATIATGVIYVAHRVKQKVAEIKTSALSAKQQSKGASGGSSNPDFSSVMKDLSNAGAAANAGTQGGVPAGTPEDPEKSLADAALVSQALLRNLDKSPSEIPASDLPAGTGPISKPTPDSYTWTSGGSTVLWENDLVRIRSARGASVYGQCPVIKPAVSATAPSAPARANGNQDHDWKLQYERTEGGPEADLVVRTGDINNLGFGWPQDFDPFSGKSTPPHSFPWKANPESPSGTDRIMLGTSFGPKDSGYDGYSRTVSCSCPANWAPCENRLQAMPSPIEIQIGALPSKINEVLVQMFVDDFQAKGFHSHFQVSLNGTRIPSFEYAINSLDQTGPIGKLVTFKLLPEYWPLLKSGKVKLFIDDPTTHIGDGYAVDFARILALGEGCRRRSAHSHCRRNRLRCIRLGFDGCRREVSIERTACRVSSGHGNRTWI
jgi:hypothetical protein